MVNVSEAIIPLRCIRTCTKAVAIRTPVPKCLHAKNILAGIFTHFTFFATTGKPAPKQEKPKTKTILSRQPKRPLGARDEWSHRLQRPTVCRTTSYSPDSLLLPHSGFIAVMPSAMLMIEIDRD